MTSNYASGQLRMQHEQFSAHEKELYILLERYAAPYRQFKFIRFAYSISVRVRKLQDLLENITSEDPGCARYSFGDLVELTYKSFQVCNSCIAVHRDATEAIKVGHYIRDVLLIAARIGLIWRTTLNLLQLLSDLYETERQSCDKEMIRLFDHENLLPFKSTLRDLRKVNGENFLCPRSVDVGSSRRSTIPPDLGVAVSREELLGVANSNTPKSAKRVKRKSQVQSDNLQRKSPEETRKSRPPKEKKSPLKQLKDTYLSGMAEQSFVEVPMIKKRKRKDTKLNKKMMNMEGRDKCRRYFQFEPGTPTLKSNNPKPKKQKKKKLKSKKEQLANDTSRRTPLKEAEEEESNSAGLGAATLGHAKSGGAERDVGQKIVKIPKTRNTPRKQTPISQKLSSKKQKATPNNQKTRLKQSALSKKLNKLSKKNGKCTKAKPFSDICSVEDQKTVLPKRATTVLPKKATQKATPNNQKTRLKRSALSKKLNMLSKKNGKCTKAKPFSDISSVEDQKTVLPKRNFTEDASSQFINGGSGSGTRDSAKLLRKKPKNNEGLLVRSVNMSKLHQKKQLTILERLIESSGKVGPENVIKNKKKRPISEVSADTQKFAGSPSKKRRKSELGARLKKNMKLDERGRSLGSTKGVLSKSKTKLTSPNELKFETKPKQRKKSANRTDGIHLMSAEANTRKAVKNVKFVSAKDFRRSSNLSKSSEKRVKSRLQSEGDINDIFGSLDV